VSRASGLSRGTVSRVLDRLEADGFLVPTGELADGRWVVRAFPWRLSQKPRENGPVPSQNPRENGPTVPKTPGKRDSGRRPGGTVPKTPGKWDGVSQKPRENGTAPSRKPRGNGPHQKTESSYRGDAPCGALPPPDPERFRGRGGGL
jgi:hypothetical protein